MNDHVAACDIQPRQLLAINSGDLSGDDRHVFEIVLNLFAVNCHLSNPTVLKQPVDILAEISYQNWLPGTPLNGPLRSEVIQPP